MRKRFQPAFLHAPPIFCCAAALVYLVIVPCSANDAPWQKLVDAALEASVRHDFAASERDYRQAMEMAQAQGSPVGVLATTQSLISIMVREGKYKETEKYFSQLVSTAQSLKSKNSLDDTCLMNLDELCDCFETREVYMHKWHRPISDDEVLFVHRHALDLRSRFFPGNEHGDLDLAKVCESCFKRNDYRGASAAVADTAARATDHPIRRARLLVLLAALDEKCGEQKRAGPLRNEAREVFNKSGSPEGYWTAMADSERRLGNSDASYKYSLEGIKACKQPSRDLVVCLELARDHCITVSQWSQAERYARQALALAKKLNCAGLYEYETLSDILTKENRLAEARQVQADGHKMDDGRHNHRLDDMKSLVHEMTNTKLPLWSDEK